MRKRANAPRRLAILALMAVLGLNLSSCEDIPVGTGRPSPEIPEITVRMTVSGSATKDGSVTADVSLSMNRDPGSDVFYVIENHTPDVCTIEPMQIDVDRDDWEISQSLVVSGIDNGVAGNQDCRFTATLYDKDGNILASDSGVVIVSDLALPDVDITVTVRGNASEDGSVTSDVGLAMNRDPGSDVTYIIENHTPGVCTIEPMEIKVDREDWEETQTIVVSGVPDGIVTGDRECRFTVTLVDNEGNELASKPGVVIIEDAESPGLHIVGSSKHTSEDGTSVTFDIWLHTQPTEPVTVVITSSLITEGVLVDKDGNPVDQIILTFTPENWDQHQTITVMGVPDGVVDGDRDYDIIFVVVSDDEHYNGYRATRPLVNIDIDVPSLGIEGDITNIIVSESGTTAELPIVLTSVPVCPVTVHIVSSDTTEAVVSVSTLTFTPENWNVSQIVTVTGVPDFIDDGDQAFTITITASGCFFDSAEPIIVHGINENIDVAGIAVTKESDIIIVSEAGLTSEVEVVLTSKPTAPVTITLKVDDENVATTSVTHLTFTPENWNVPQTFVVHGVDNDIVDGHRPFVIDLTAASEDPKYHEAFIPPVHGICLDDDADAEVYVHPWTVFITSGLLTATFTVVLTADPEEDVAFPILLEGIGAAAGFAIDKTEVYFSHTNWWRPQVVTVSIAAEIPNAFGNFFIEIGPDPAATAVYKDADPHDVVVLYDFRNACSEPTVLGAGTYKLEVWGAQGGWTKHRHPERYYFCGDDKDEWIKKCIEHGIDELYGDGACEYGLWSDWCEEWSWNTENEEASFNRGGYASGILTLTEETKVWRCEGGQGDHGSPFDRIVQGGRNGGGNSGFASYMGHDNSGGGGGSDIRIGMNTLYHRVIVAGGAGGNGCCEVGGVGGGLEGFEGVGFCYPPNGLGGTQTEGGASVGREEYLEWGVNTFSEPGKFGYGGAASAFEANYGGAGGGGGWFGGSGANHDPGGGSAGGGGSGYVLTATSHKPAGYALGTQYHLMGTVLLDGLEEMPAPGGGVQVGQSGDGVVRISKCDSAGNNCVVCLDGICPE